MLFDANYDVKRINVISELKDEAGMLEDFARMMEERRPNVVTFNGRWLRHAGDRDALLTLRHSVSALLPLTGRALSLLSPEGHLDLMDYVADFGAAKPSKLDIVAKLCGMPGKVGIDGKDVGPMVHAGRIQEVRKLLPV